MTEISNKPPLSVVMVTLNEEQAIAKVVSDIMRVVPESEIVIVDSSTDRTAEIAAAMGCRVLKQLPPRGYGPALGEALKAARAPVVVTIDCDDTYPAEAILLLVEKIQAGYDIASASRLKGKPAAMFWPNYFANLVFAKLACLLCQVKITDVHTGMRAYKNSLLQAFQYDPIGMALPVELLVGPAVLGCKYTEIFIDYRPRIGVSTLRPLEGTWWTLKRLWKWRRCYAGSRQDRLS